MADVRLVDLEVFKRYSLAIRQESAPADEVLAVLEATRRQVQAAGPAGTEPVDPATTAWGPEEDDHEDEAAERVGRDDAGTEPEAPRRVRRRARGAAPDGR